METVKMENSLIYIFYSINEELLRTSNGLTVNVKYRLIEMDSVINGRPLHTSSKTI